MATCVSDAHFLSYREKRNVEEVIADLDIDISMFANVYGLLNTAACHTTAGRMVISIQGNKDFVVDYSIVRLFGKHEK